MRMPKNVAVQLTVFAVISLVAFTVLAIGYARLPRLWFDAGYYPITVELPTSGGLYPRSNVTYQGTEVGLVDSVTVTKTGVQANLSLNSKYDIPANVTAEVHSVSAVGEQYLALVPHDNFPSPLKAHDVIPAERTSTPPDINSLLDATNRGLEAIPGDNLKTVIDQSYLAVGGLGPDIARLVKGSTALATASRNNLDELLNLTDNAAPLLNTQTDTSAAIQAWAASMSEITSGLKANDQAVQGVLQHGAAASDEVRKLFDQIKPTLPVLLANLVSVGQVAVTYHAGVEQLLVLLPQATAATAATILADQDLPNKAYSGAYLSFALNLNLPPPCLTGFLPPQQRRSAAFEDYPDPPSGDIYCRVPQDSAFNVRGARNAPCPTVPGKRAATPEMCESDEHYVPLNEGYNWKGDPNATLSGQPVPEPPMSAHPGQQLAPEAAPLPIAAARYDPITGSYVGPDGQVYTQANLAQDANENKTWQDLLLPKTE